MGVHGVKKLTPPPLLTFNACLKYLLGLLPRTKNADPRLLGVKKQPPRLLILLALKPCWFIGKWSSTKVFFDIKKNGDSF